MPRIMPEKRVWFDVPDDPDGGSVEIRHIKDGEIQELISKNNETRTVYDRKTEKTYSRIRQRRAPALVMATAAVCDWKNHIGKDGKTMSCTPENVSEFLKEDGYLSFINACIGKVAKMVEQDKAEKEKN
jgi:hypothetical protein